MSAFKGAGACHCPLLKVTDAERRAAEETEPGSCVSALRLQSAGHHRLNALICVERRPVAIPPSWVPGFVIKPSTPRGESRHDTATRWHGRWPFRQRA